VPLEPLAALAKPQGCALEHVYARLLPVELLGEGSLQCAVRLLHLRIGASVPLALQDVLRHRARPPRQRLVLVGELLDRPLQRRNVLGLR